jgi:hypothetical protein
MKESISRISTRYEWLKAMPLVLLFLAVVGYGLLIPWLGFFWDDFPVAWIADRLGSDGLERYFSTNRPMLSWLYQVTMPLFGTQTPWHWHVFALFTRFTAALAFYALARTIWGRHSRLAIWASLFFVVYPGFKQQWVSIIYGHFFLILTGLFISFYLSVRSVKLSSHPGETQPSDPVGVNWKVILFTALAWLLAFQNLLFLDYFFFLEFIRPVLLWKALEERIPNRKQRFKLVIRAWSPFALLLVGFILWRFITLKSQPHLYHVTIIDKLLSEPLTALLNLGKNILYSLWIALPAAWGGIFQLPEFKFGVRTALITLVLIGSTFAVFVLYFSFLRLKLPAEANPRKGASAFIWIGLVACLLAGWSIWLPELVIGTRFSADRFSLVFLPGSALILAGMIGLLPARSLFPWLMVAFLVSVAAGQHFITANAYRKDWEFQQRFFWQLSWRVPDLKAGTLLLAEGLPFTFYTDNSLTAPFNWIYAPDNTTSQMSFLLFYPDRRLGTTLPALEPGLPINVNYLAANFLGNTSQAVGFTYNPPACLRILEPDLDVENKMLPEDMQLASALSSTAPIITDTTGGPVNLPESFYGEEPAHGWCYFYEKADLARQQGNWEQVVALGEQAFATGDYPNDPMERIPFIEGYAHVANWDKAVELTHASLNVTPMMEPVLCRLWERISTATPASPEKGETLQKLFDEMNCLQK